MKVRSILYSNCICGLAACVPLCPAATGSLWSLDNIDYKNSLAPYVGSAWSNIDEMLDLADFKEGDRVLDVGAGKFCLSLIK